MLTIDLLTDQLASEVDFPFDVIYSLLLIHSPADLIVKQVAVTYNIICIQFSDIQNHCR